MMRRHSEDCASDFKLDCLLAGEVPPDEQRAVEAHFGSCDRCQQRYARLSESRRTFSREAPSFAAFERSEPSVQMRESGSSSRAEPVAASRRSLANRRLGGERSHWLLAASALAAAAALVLVMGSPWSSSFPSDRDTAGATTRTKGGPASLGWVVRRGEHVFTGRPWESLRAGDSVRFTISTREPVYVAILALDAAGRLSMYYPDGEQLSKIDVGRDQLLPAAIELDAAGDVEHLYAVFGLNAVAVSSVRDAIERSPDAPALPSGCSMDRSTLNEAVP